MKPGSLILHDNKLGVVYRYPKDNLAKQGARITYENGSIAVVYSELPEVTEFTPEICKRAAAMLPRTVFAAWDKGAGLTGTDPEIFAFDKKGVVIPAWDWLPHRTVNPDTYWDGVQAEFTTNPTSCHNYQTDGVRNKLLAIDTLLKEKYPGAHLATTDVVKLDRKTLLSAEDDHIILGCSPSRNAYPTVKPIEIGDPREHPFRYSGCHLHMSVMEYPLPPWFPEGTVVMMDKLAGVLLTALGRDMEDPIRRKAYGRAGEFRVPAPVPVDTTYWGTQFKDHTWKRLEYRTPGSFLLHHPALFNFAMDTARAAFRMGLLMDGRLLDEIGDVQGIINNCDADAAVKLITAKNSYYQTFLNGTWNPNYSSHTKTLAVLKQGAKASGRFGDSVYTNWKLGDSWNGDNYGNGQTQWAKIIA